jgi:hypothetical protein
MKALTRVLAGAVLLGPFVAMGAGCNDNQQMPLAKVPEPPKLPSQDKTNIKPPQGSSPDVLPSQ